MNKFNIWFENGPSGRLVSVRGYEKGGKSTADILKEFGSAVFREGTVKPTRKKICVTFPGKFQPYHKGHEFIYKQLINMFGEESMWILPSERIEFPSKPLSFDERKRLILKSKKISVDPKHIRARKSKGFNRSGLAKDLGIADKMEEYIFIVILSIQDSKLIKMKDKETYYQPYPQQLYDVSIDELQELTEYLPSMKYYGFKFVVDAVESEMGDDYGIKPERKSRIGKRIGLSLTIAELRKHIVDGTLDEVEDKLPYDIEEIKKMTDSIVGSEETIEKVKKEIEEKEEEKVLSKSVVRRLKISKGEKNT